MNKKFKVGVVGATGYVGQRFVSLLENHPWFEVAAVTASPRSEGKLYKEACEGRWKMPTELPEKVGNLTVLGTESVEKLCDQVDFVFCAVDMAKEPLISLEERIARLEIPVISNNSVNRWTPDIPMIIPEVNHKHICLIEAQQKRLKTKRGFIVAKPNCSTQSFVPALTPLLDLGLENIFICTMQAVSGAGKTLGEWPEIQQNIIPFINGEEEKTELEPLKLWGTVSNGRVELLKKPLISSQCIRVPVQEGHSAAVWLRFKKRADANEILMRWRNFEPYPQQIDLPSAPKPFLRYIEEADRPQPRLDAVSRHGMGITIGRLREDPIYDYKFISLSHNTVRGAAGGGILTAELLVHEGYIQKA